MSELVGTITERELNIVSNDWQTTKMQSEKQEIIKKIRGSMKIGNPSERK
jgi:hypothetical protein